MPASTRRRTGSKSACAATSSASRTAPGRRPSGREAAPQIPYSILEAPSDEAARSDYHPVVIAETTRPLLRLSVSDAIVELDLTGAPALVFVHAGSGRVNVVYRRGDGTIGWVDPPPGENA